MPVHFPRSLIAPNWTKWKHKILSCTYFCYAFFRCPHCNTARLGDTATAPIALWFLQSVLCMRDFPLIDLFWIHRCKSLLMMTRSFFHTVVLHFIFFFSLFDIYVFCFESWPENDQSMLTEENIDCFKINWSLNGCEHHCDRFRI